MYLTKEPAGIDSVLFEENILKIKCTLRTVDRGVFSNQRKQVSVPGRMTVELFAPALNVVSVRIKNHNIIPRARIATLYDHRDPAYGEVEQNDNEIIFKSGRLEARIPKTGIFGIRFFYCGVLLTTSNPDEGFFYRSGTGAAGSLKVDVFSSVTGASIAMFNNEKIYGLGGAAGSIIRNGDTVKTYKRKFHSGTEAIPFYISTSGYGLMVNSAGSTEFGIGTDGLSATFCTKGETLEYDLIAGDDMSAIFGSYVQLTGMSNPVSENCVAGAPVILDSSSRTTADSVLNVVLNAKDSGLRISEVWLGNSWHPQNDPFGFAWDKTRFPDPVQFARSLHDLGTSLCLSVNPYIAEASPEFGEALDMGYLISDSKGCAVICETPMGGIGLVDLRKLPARNWLTNQFDELFKMGCDRFESDFSGAYGSIFASALGDDGEAYIASFSEILNSAASDTMLRQRGRFGTFIIADSVSAGDRRTVFRNICPDSTPGFPALAAAMRNSVSYGMSGLTSVNIDVPDIAAQDPVLFGRWLQFAAFTPHFRLNCGGAVAGGRQEAFSLLKNLTDLRTGLAPYLYSTICEGVKYGLPAMRAMIMEFPNDLAAMQAENQYMLGSSLLVCPVLTRNGQITAYIPAGIWTDFMTREKIRGPKYLVRNVDNDTIPVFVRPNSILVTRSNDSHHETGILDGLTFTCFELAPGSVAACEVFGEDGNTSGVIRVTCSGSKITVNTTGFGKNKRIVLADIVNVVSVSESMPEQTQFGTMIEFSGNELIIGLG